MVYKSTIPYLKVKSLALKGSTRLSDMHVQDVNYSDE